jgi:hypothetical protein
VKKIFTEEKNPTSNRTEKNKKKKKYRQDSAMQH